MDIYTAACFFYAMLTLVTTFIINNNTIIRCT